ncbi:MAG: argininosuccinate synthase [Fervidicoccaceae archaeon]
MRVVLAYSGGLDTTVSVALLRERLEAEVITVTVNVGQREDFHEIESRAYAAGASKHYTIDGVAEFAEKYILPCIMLNCCYEEKYPLGTALARPFIAKVLAEVARLEGADAVAHGSTSKGNDQVRFDLTLMVEAPGAKILTPVRMWRLTRDWEIEYAKKRGLPIKVDPSKKYSVDENLWSRSVEGGPIDDESLPPPEDAFEWTISPEKAPNDPLAIELEFAQGRPIALNGERLALHELIARLNFEAGRHAIGRIDMIENRLVGLKSREIYEAPAATVLLTAHKELEKLVLTPREYRLKRTLDFEWSDLVYQGLWYEPARSVIQKMAEEMNSYVTGRVSLRAYKGALSVVGRESPYSLYSKTKADYERGWFPSEEEAVGFIKIWGMHSIDAYLKRRAVGL